MNHIKSITDLQSSHIRREKKEEKMEHRLSIVTVHTWEQREISQQQQQYSFKNVNKQTIIQKM